jgi:hypothetical protein
MFALTAQILRDFNPPGGDVREPFGRGVQLRAVAIGRELRTVGGIGLGERLGPALVVAGAHHCGGKPVLSFDEGRLTRLQQAFSFWGRPRPADRL